MSISELSTELIEQVWSYIDLYDKDGSGNDLSIQGFIDHLKESYDKK